MRLHPSFKALESLLSQRILVLDGAIISEDAQC